MRFLDLPLASQFVKINICLNYWQRLDFLVAYHHQFLWIQVINSLLKLVTCFLMLNHIDVWLVNSYISSSLVRIYALPFINFVNFPLLLASLISWRLIKFFSISKAASDKVYFIPQIMTFKSKHSWHAMFYFWILHLRWWFTHLLEIQETRCRFSLICRGWILSHGVYTEGDPLAFSNGEWSPGFSILYNSSLLW